VDRCGRHGRLINGACKCTVFYSGPTCSAPIALPAPFRRFPMSNFSGTFEGDIAINKAAGAYSGLSASYLNLSCFDH
jgi:hypothetical protein